MQKLGLAGVQKCVFRMPVVSFGEFTGDWLTDVKGVESPGGYALEIAPGWVLELARRAMAY